MTVREARAKATGLVLSADQDQLDDIREWDETRESCRDRLLRLAPTSPDAHTPGPWLHSHRKVGRGHSTQVYTGDGQEICTLAWYPMPPVAGVVRTYREANARLIASAPRLLKELEHLAACLHPWIESGHSVPGIATLNGAWAAIKEARGEA